MDEQLFLKSIFAGDNAAFKVFYEDCRSLFLAFFNKHHPGARVNIRDLYQESVIQLWSNIMDGKVSESGFSSKRGLYSYVIQIGLNKFMEELRKVSKNDKLKKGELVFKKRTTKTDEIEEDDKELFPLQSKKQQEEIERSTRINDKAYQLYNKKQVDPFEDPDNTKDRKERILEWSHFLREKYEELGYPCSQLLRDTWYNNMSDSEIIDAFGGYFSNTNVVKTKRYKCHKALLNMFNAWKVSHN